MSYYYLSPPSRTLTYKWNVLKCSDVVTPTNAEFIPTGEILPVAGTPWDFTTPHTIGERIAEVTFPPPYGGYDINYGLFDLDETEAADLTLSCTLLGLEWIPAFSCCAQES